MYKIAVKLLARLFLFPGLLLSLCIPSFAQDDLCKAACTFVLLEENSGTYEAINESRSKERFPPFSTFKVANSLIALELGIVENLEQKLSFDRSAYPVQGWWPEVWHKAPLNLKEAFKYSALPVYQQIANQVGEQHMQGYVSKFEFGNADISSGVDTFWLGGSLKVSAQEQTAFLQKLYNRKLPVSASTVSKLKEIMLVEQTDQYKLYAKTGGGYLPNGSAIGWYVGFVENKSGVFYFALNLTAATFDQLKDKRKSIAAAQLKKAGVI